MPYGSNVLPEFLLTKQCNLQDWSRISGLGPDAFLDSILTGSNDEIQEGFDRPLSDTSSDSGCTYDGQQQLLSPEPPTSSANNKVDLIEYISNPEDDEDGPLHAVVNPRTNSPEPDTVFDTGATTIILPVITPVCTWKFENQNACIW